MASLDELLPNEIWMKILNYVSVADRAKHVQFVNKRFHVLASDRTLTRNVTFSSSVFLLEKACLEILRRSKNWIEKLSFRNCHWFSHSMFGLLPKMKNLRSLDLTNCFLTAVQLLKMLKKMEHLKILAISLNLEEERKLEIKTPIDLEICLSVLHINLHINDFRTVFVVNAITNQRLLIDFVQFFYNRFLHEECRKMLCIDVHDPDCVIRFYHFPPHFMMENCRPTDIGRSIKDVPLSYKMFIENLSPQYSRLFTKFDFTKLRFLSLFIIDHSRTSQHDLFSTKSSHTFPNLEHLTITDGLCYTESECRCVDVLLYILCNCELPKLKSLHIGALKVVGQFEEIKTIWKNVFKNISSCKDLEEINFCQMPVDISFLKHFAVSKKLRAISIPFVFVTENAEQQSNSVIHSGEKRRRISKYNKDERKTILISDLVEKFPCLENLDIVGNLSGNFCASTLANICQLTHLQVLSITDVCFSGLHHLSAILKKCPLLISLTLQRIGHQQHCIYETILADRLKYLPNLKELRLHHPRLQVTRRLFQTMMPCKNLERVILGADSPQDISSTALMTSIQTVMSRCLKLHTLILMMPCFSEMLKTKVTRYLKTLKKEGRRPMIVCDLINPEQPLRTTNLSFQYVGSHYVYDYPYSILSVY